MSSRLLLVEPSATMRYVLEKHAQSLGFTVESIDNYETAQTALNSQYQRFGQEYSGVLLGWPSTPSDQAAQLATLLEQAEFTDLPVVVMSTDMRAETRAWVAGRSNTAVLPWKEYQGLEGYLQRLLDVEPEDTEKFKAKFDNKDIQLLVVDDSSTIRLSLRDLFQMQGYRVSLAATEQEALRLARANRFDIAVLDFYLTDTTGDQVCRALLADESTGDIVCTVLTGTYSDHIIKRSLRAGAVECMFKNESSELLLSRIDAISRFVRQKRQLEGERGLLENIVDSAVGSLLVIDANHQIRFLSSSALKELGLETADSIVGQTSESLIQLEGLAGVGTGLHSATWRLPDNGEVGVDYEHLLVDQNGYSFVRFVRRTMAIDSGVTRNGVASTQYQDKKNVSLPADAHAFIDQFHGYLHSITKLKFQVSFLVLDVFLQNSQSQAFPLTKQSVLSETVKNAVLAIYRREGHVAQLSENRFAFLLRHQEATQAYLLVRKIMQICLEIPHDEAYKIRCTGSLLSLTENPRQSMNALIRHAFKGVELVNQRGYDQVLLMDLRRMLLAYPVS